MHKGGNVGIFVLLEFENKSDIVRSRLKFYSMLHEKCIFTLKWIKLLSVSKFISIRNCTEMPMLQLSCATRKRLLGNSTSKLN